MLEERFQTEDVGLVASRCLLTTRSNPPLLLRPGYQDHGAAEEVKGIVGRSCRDGKVVWGLRGWAALGERNREQGLAVPPGQPYTRSRCQWP